MKSTSVNKGTIEGLFRELGAIDQNLLSTESEALIEAMSSGSHGLALAVSLCNTHEEAQCLAELVLRNWGRF